MPKLDWQPQATDVPREDAPHLPGIRVMSPTHDQILEAILANPEINLGDIAAMFRVTPSWLSCIIHSDCFQAKLAEAQAEMYGDLRLTVKDRITSLAHRSMTRLAEKIEVEQDIARITDVAELSLKALGFTGQSNGRPVGQMNVQNNLYLGAIDRQTLAEARRSMMRVVAQAPTTIDAADVSPDSPTSQSPR